VQGASEMEVGVKRWFTARRVNRVCWGFESDKDEYKIYRGIQNDNSISSMNKIFLDANGGVSKSRTTLNQLKETALLLGRGRRVTFQKFATYARRISDLIKLRAARRDSGMFPDWRNIAIKSLWRCSWLAFHQTLHKASIRIGHLLY
jgi:hypothetical protein